MSRPIGLQTSTPLKMKFQFTPRPCCQMPFRQWARAAGPHPPSAFLPSEIREVLRRAGPGGPRTPPQLPSTAHPVTVSPGHSRDPPSLSGLPQHHTHCLSPAPSPETLPHQLSFPGGPWRVSLSACSPNLTSHYAQGSGVLHPGPAQPEGLVLCLWLLVQDPGPEV